MKNFCLNRAFVKIYMCTTQSFSHGCNINVIENVIFVVYISLTLFNWKTIFRVFVAWTRLVTHFAVVNVEMDYPPPNSARIPCLVSVNVQLSSMNVNGWKNFSFEECNVNNLYEPRTMGNKTEASLLPALGKCIASDADSAELCNIA